LDKEEVTAARERLLSTDVDVIGVTDHGFVQTIYFFDPNGLRLELSARTSDVAAEQEAHTGRARMSRAAMRAVSGQSKRLWSNKI